MPTKRTQIRLAAACAVMLGVLASNEARAQTATPQQFVVVYGELKPVAGAQIGGAVLLDYLTRLARSSSGAQYFTVNFEIGRPNFFNITEVWSSAATYTAFTGASNTQQVLANLTPILIAPLDERDGNLVTP